MTTTTRSPHLQAALDRKRETDAAFRDHCETCNPCRMVGLCAGGQRLNDACDDAATTLKDEVLRCPTG